MSDKTVSSATHSAKIAENLRLIHQQIEAYCQRYQRSSQEVSLLAVSKTKPSSDIRAAYNAGQHSFAENYLQEALEKIDELSDLDIEWHFIGAIQSNKTRELASHFHWVHSVDRLKIARRLSEQRPESLPELNICLQINISHESSKSGTDIQQLPGLVEDIMKLPRIKLRGLMAIPAKADTLAEQRAVFAQMKNLLQQLQQIHPDLDTLSMGMSNDLEAAIAEGSTLLRIGTAIFGART